MASMTIPLAEYILDVVSVALQDERHRRHPISALRGFDIFQIFTACKLRLANQYLAASAVADLRGNPDQRLAEAISLFDSLPLTISMTFVADRDVDEILRMRLSN
jgi:hypothetical protein